MKKTLVMNCLIPFVLLCLTMFFAVHSNTDRPAVAQQQAAWKAGAGPSQELRQEPPAAGAFAGPASAADHRVANEGPGLSRAMVIETEAIPVCGSEAEADAIESTGILNRLELFEF